METNDSSGSRHATSATTSFHDTSPVKHFLTRAGEWMFVRAYWPALGLLAAVGILLYWNTSAIVATNESRIQLRTLLVELQNLQTTLNEAETGQRGYLLVGEESYLEPYQTAMKAVDQKIDRVGELMDAVPGQRSAYDAMRRLAGKKIAELKQMVQLRQGPGIEAAMQVVRAGRGQDLMAGIRAHDSQIKHEIQARLAEQDQRTVDLSEGAACWGILGIVLAALLFIAVIRRELRERARIELRARELALSVEATRIETLKSLKQSDGKIEAIGQQAGDLARSVESLRTQAVASGREPARDLAEEIEVLVRQARDLATSVETSRILTLNQSEKRIEALERQARDLATSVEKSRLQTLDQSDKEIEALGQQARDISTSVERSRIQTLNQSDKRIEAMGQQARDLAISVESSRVQTLDQSDKELVALAQQARELAMMVESSRVQTLDQSDKEIEGLWQRARDLATTVETSRVQTLDQSDKEIEALGQQARELATLVETSRLQTLVQSDGKIEALGQKALQLATVVERSRLQALNRSNQEIRKLNEGLEQRVLDRTAQLEAANKELDSFSYSVSHDLRAPLRAINGFSRIVLEDYGDALPPEGKVYLQKVRDNTLQMGRLVDDLLSFARLGRQSLAKDSVDPNQMTRQCLAEMTREQQGRQVEIIIGELPSCQADPTLLKQVWTNLISNALKYTRKREVAHLEIGSRLEPRPAHDGQPAAPAGDGLEVVYFVKDNGAGFDMKYVGKLFGVFQRLHSAADYEGTGVGLAIVQRIVQRHGGRIWADATLDQGATFSFTLA